MISMWTFSKQRLERQEGWKWAGDKSLPEVGHVVDGPQSSSPEPVSSTQSQTALQNWKTNSKPSQHDDSRGLADGSLNLPQRKEARQRNKLPVHKHSENQTLKYNSWRTTKLISLTWGQHANLNCHTSLREQLTKQLPLKDRRRKTLHISQPPSETMAEYLLKCQH
jgi:hypothetical protein